jgi:ABC-type molybdate transport system substrate-binding protein
MMRRAWRGGLFRFGRARLAGVVAAGLLAAAPGRAAELVAVPPTHDSDLRYFAADGAQRDGVAAFAAMRSADVNLWVAGNQFFAMARVVGAFQAQHPGLSVGLITLPPGLILEAIKAGGWSYADRSLPIHPDVFGTVSIEQLRATGLIDEYRTYMHNALELMVARGNPRQVTGLADLVRPGLRVTLPNPLTEGIMTFYGKPLLVRLGLWQRLSPGPDCADCDPTPAVHFATVHHREIPARIAAGETDVGLVWHTEAVAAIARGAPIEGVALPADQNAAAEVIYVAGELRDTRHAAAAAALFGFFGSDAAQRAYASFGFRPATPAERTPRPVPP